MLAACAAPTTSVQMQFAAKSDAAQYHRVAVLPFDGNGGLQASRDFESMLASVQYEGKPYFTVVDRMTLQNVFKELSLQQSALVSKSNAAKLGKLLNVEALYSGSASVLPTAYSHSSESRTVCHDNKCHDVSVSCTTKSVGYKLSPRLVEVSRGQVVYAEAKVGSASAYWCEDSGTQVSDQVLLQNAVNSAYEQVREDVAPYQKAVSVRYKTDDKGLNPASGDAFKGAIEFAKAGRFDRACAIWSQLAPTNPASLSVAFDLAVCAEMSGQLDRALASYQQIDQGLTKPDDDVNKALARVKDALVQRSELNADDAKAKQTGSNAARRKPAGPVSMK